MSVTVGEIVNVLNTWAPLSLKESWDNPGLLIGNPDETVDKLLVTLDVMMDTVDYAIEQGVTMIVSTIRSSSTGLNRCGPIRITGPCTKNC